MLFKKGTQIYSYEIIKEVGEDVMYLNYLGVSSVPSIADSAETMYRTIDALIENPNTSRVVFVQQRNYSYDFKQVSYLLEIAQLCNYLLKQERILSPEKLVLDCQECLGKRYEQMTYFLTMLKQDVIFAYYEIKRFLREERKEVAERCRECNISYIRLLNKIRFLLENLSLVKESEKYIGTYEIGERGIYNKFFRADIIPNFTFTRLVASLPEDADIINEYEIGSSYDKSTVTILKRKSDTKYIYHLTPPEYVLDENFHLLLNLARNVLIEHKPKAEEFTDVERTRQVFFNISRDLLQELAENKKIALSYEELAKLATILVRYTIGFGLIEILLQDSKLQDIFVNAPIPSNPVFVRHSEFDECVTNVFPSQEDADSWAAKFRLLSGRPLDEANPILDTDLSIGKVRARVAVIQQPLSPKGLAYAIRRHREEPWTLPLFIKNKMLNSFSAGLLSFLVDGSRTMLIAGTRSSGKCVDGNTLIQLTNGDIQPIKNLEHGKKDKISDGYIFYPNPEIKILSLSDNLKIDEKAVNAFWKRESPKNLVKIITKSGKEIITTPEHPYFIFDNNLKSVYAENLREGMLIATPRRISIHTNGEIFIPEAKELISQIRTNAQKITFPEKVNSELAEFLGYLIGDGHIDECKIEFTNSDFQLRKRFSEHAQKLFSVSTKERKDRNTFNIQINSRILNRALNKIFEIPLGNKASNVRIPSKILKSGNYILASFLRAYFDSDGYIPRNKRDIELGTASEIMAKQLQIVLLRFGIISFLKSRKIKNKTYYRVLIRGEFVNKFIEEIGFNQESKKKRAEEILKISWLENTNIDIIPDGNYFLKEVRRELRARPSEVRKITGKDYWAYENNSYNVTRRWFKILIEFYNARFNHLLSLKNEIEELNENSNLDSFKKFREILNIKNEELTEELSIMTVSNFFNEIYKPKIKTKKAIAEKIKGIYKRSISEGVSSLLERSFKLSISDIFWDRVKNIEKVVPKESWVYDFTVEPTQNFIANGIFAHNTSMLGALMLEIMPKFRIILIEDTLELPADSLRKLGYDILRMKVRSALLQTTTEIAADEGIRTSLRLGDSCLIVGEVRSLEAKSLYEAMRVGALANVVAGTIHGASPYAVFDRVVNDLQVPITSFKATDAILVCNPVKSPSGLQSWRRAISLSEVRKHWTKDPEEERGFVDLLKYNVEKDELEVTDELINGESEIIKGIAGNVKGWAGNWDAVYDNILLRGKVKQEIVDVAEKLDLQELLEARFNSLSNSVFYEISEKVRKEIGLPFGERVFPIWQEWLRKKAGEMKEGKN